MNELSHGFVSASRIAAGGIRVNPHVATECLLLPVYRYVINQISRPPEEGRFVVLEMVLECSFATHEAISQVYTQAATNALQSVNSQMYASVSLARAQLDACALILYLHPSDRDESQKRFGEYQRAGLQYAARELAYKKTLLKHLPDQEPFIAEYEDSLKNFCGMIGGEWEEIREAIESATVSGLVFSSSLRDNFPTPGGMLKHKSSCKDLYAAQRVVAQQWSIFSHGVHAGLILYADLANTKYGIQDFQHDWMQRDQVVHRAQACFMTSYGCLLTMLTMLSRRNLQRSDSLDQSLCGAWEDLLRVDAFTDRLYEEWARDYLGILKN